MEDLHKARGEHYYAAIDVVKQENLENGKGKYGPDISVGFGYSIFCRDLMKIAAVADVLHCSVDYLLGRTESPVSYLGTELQKQEVSYQDTTWQTGEPKEAGTYILLLGFDSSTHRTVEQWDWDERTGWHDDSILLDVEDGCYVMGWIPTPKEKVKS